ncbi:MULTISPECIES: phage virion morphogenesis protein [Serratia]|uniref:phage virion morphogenesis protein n=1 Tax=Serratia TaxID=613 RepID=UPI0007453470|nr:phage virion morphogenesis protein [Serratia marcescens]HEJ7948091.1 phage virion morphogenesis protein [Serratia liquefaciens]EJD6705174.1 phage virion morphogenesis protein [Serratia marcescens]CUZ66920.1 Mu-like prophage protein gpG [Serratia marcescens]CVB49039.1 Mu-like prophage protein gpG [Serratia marcescens]CVB58699.1 Mu-like prophage protein gpG [Serratia marcescens]
MAGATLTFDYQDALNTLLSTQAALADPAPLLAGMGEKLLEFHQQRFREQKSPDGEPWTDLSPRYKKRKRKNKDKILTLDGPLRNTLRWQVNAEELLFGTDRVYGAIHQFGGTIEIAARSQQAYYRQKKNGKVDNRFFRKSKSNLAKWHTLPAHTVTIPARPWLGVSAEQGDRLVELAKNYLQRQLNP